MEKKVYKIQGVRFTQTEMTLRQDKELIRLWKEAGLSGERIQNIRDVNGLIDLLIENDVMERFLQIILNGPREEVNWSEIPNSVLIEVINDFLALNGKWIGKLKGFLNGFLSNQGRKAR